MKRKPAQLIRDELCGLKSLKSTVLFHKRVFVYVIQISSWPFGLVRRRSPAVRQNSPNCRILWDKQFFSLNMKINRRPYSVGSHGPLCAAEPQRAAPELQPRLSTRRRPAGRFALAARLIWECRSSRCGRSALFKAAQNKDPHPDLGGGQKF